MTDQQHPITPPLELVNKWGKMLEYCEETDVFSDIARWGYQQCMKLDAAWLEAKLQKARDQELEACCEWFKAKEWIHPEFSDKLRAARRPKSQSLKEQAHEALGRFFSNAHTQASQMTQDFEIIRRAVEQLND